MTYLVFSFDVEDYINPNAADGILWSAELLHRAGVKGCFNIVARLAEALVEWGREDVILGQGGHKCGNVYGFLENPSAITAPLTVTAEEIRASAEGIGDGFLPTEITVGEQVIGPADWLRAAMAVLCGEERVTLTPAPWQIDMDQFPAIRDMKLSDGWIHRADFRDEHLSRRARLQSWTFRLPKGSQRKVFS